VSACRRGARGCKLPTEADRPELLHSAPRQLAIALLYWTVVRLRIIIRRQFQITFSPSGLWRFLRREGLSPQRPLKRALERDEEAIRRWVRQEYPRIRAEARNHRAILYFGDESGVRTDHVSGRTWAQRATRRRFTGPAAGTW
jgi:hypothetical protein